jgi:hypothetical protein
MPHEISSYPEMARAVELKPRKKPLQERSGVTVEAILEAAAAARTEEGWSGDDAAAVGPQGFAHLSARGPRLHRDYAGDGGGRGPLRSGWRSASGGKSASNSERIPVKMRDS